MDCIKTIFSIIGTFLSENAAVITSISALFVAAYTSYIHRRHFRLSLKPILSVDYLFDFEKNDEGVTKFYQLAIEVLNAGHGPAIIQSAKLTCNDDSCEFKSREVNTLIKKYFSKWSADHPEDFFFYLHEGSVVPAGQSVEVSRLSFYYDDKTILELDMLLSNLKVSFTYKSIYDDVYHTIESPNSDGFLLDAQVQEDGR